MTTTPNPSLLNQDRPPVFCPGCAHDRVTNALDRAFQQLHVAGNQAAIVSDIGCSGLFDTFFNTHAFHGLHGRALTYATGLKIARPELKVIATMGDGGLGIGGAHLLAACRRNLNITLLVLNNFNYGMTGGQCSSTTPAEAMVGSGFLNNLEKPIDVCQVAGTAGAGHVKRASAYGQDLAQVIAQAIEFDGFSLVDIHGVCPGRYTKKNALSPKTIAANLASLPALDHFVTQNARREYGRHYRELARQQKPVPRPAGIEARFAAPQTGRQEVVMLGGAGQRIVTAGEILCLAGISAGLNATQKNDYPITVLRGHSITELVMSKKPIAYTGIDRPKVVLALAPEGIGRRSKMLGRLEGNPLIILAKGVDLPSCRAEIHEIDFRAQKIKPADLALASLAIMAGMKRVLTPEMLEAALHHRFKGEILANALEVVRRVEIPAS